MLLRVRNSMATVVAAGALLVLAAPAHGAVMINADWDVGCGATSCFTDGRYTHTWSAGSAGGPITIGRLLLDRGILGDLDGQVFRLSFQVGGREVGSWGRYMMSEIGGAELNFWGDAFTWNPEDGDLTLVLEIDWDAARGGGSQSRGAPSSGGGGSGGAGGPGGGGHDITPGDDGDPPLDPSAAAPEPGVWALMVGGFGVMGGTLRRRRRQLRA